MERNFWLDRWERGQIGFHQQEINAALRAHWTSLRVPKDATVFVPLCGKSRDMLWLRAQGHPVLGVELSKLAVRDLFAENDATPEVTTQGRFERWSAEGLAVLCGDFFELTPADLEGVAGVYDRAALVALPPAMRQRYVAKMREVLPASAKMLLITLSYPEDEMEGPPFCVPEAEVRRLYAEGYEVRLLARSDALGDNPQIRERGPSTLTEHVFLIERS